MQEVHYYTDDVPFPDKECLTQNLQCTILHHRFLKTSALVIHRRYGHNDTPPFRNLTARATYYLSPLSSFQNVMTQH